MGFHLITLDFQNIQYIETVQINEISSEYIFLFNIHIPPPPQKNSYYKGSQLKCENTEVNSFPMLTLQSNHMLLQVALLLLV